MGTTSQKLSYLNGTKQKLKQSINALGGSIDDETTFREYVNQLDDIYEALPKTEFEEGESVTLENTLKGKLDFQDNIAGIGQAGQETTTGINLLNYIANLKTNFQGLMSQINDDGSITTMGTPAYDYVGIIDMNITSMLEIGQSYTISQKTASPYLYLQINATNTQTSQSVYYLLNNETSKTFTAQANTTYIFRLQTPTRANWGTNSRTLTNFYQLEKSSSAHAFEKCSGGYASPSPNWEQRVECVTGRNKLNLPDSTRTIGDMTVKTLNNKFSCEGIISSTYLNTLALDYSLKAGTYIISSTNNDYKFFMWLKNGNDTTVGDVHLNKFTQIIKLTEDVAKIHVGVEGLTAGTNYNIETYFQIEEGSTAHPYMPYNTIEETIHGKNILGSEIEYGGFDDSGAKIDGYSTYRNATPIPVKPNKQYIFSINGTAKNINKFYYDRNMNLISKESNVYPLITTPNNAYYLNIYKSTADGNEKWQVVEGTEGNTYTLTYEPYKTPKTYQFLLGNHKFYGIGNYRDTIRRSSGKNLFDKNAVTNGYYVNSGTGELAPASSAFNASDWIEVNTGNYIWGATSTNGYSLVVYDNNKNYIRRVPREATQPIQVTIAENEKYVRYTVSTVDLDTQQFERSATATDYEPYGVGVWYKYGVIGEKIFTGASDENWAIWQGIILIDDTTIKNLGTSNSNFYLNYFRSVLSIAYIGSNTGQRLHIQLSNAGLSEITSVSAWRTWLSTHNLEFVYVCNETVTEITGTLAEQLEAWWNGQSLDGTTIIEGNGDLSMLINVRALKGAA